MKVNTAKFAKRGTDRYNDQKRYCFRWNKEWGCSKTEEEWGYLHVCSKCSSKNHKRSECRREWQTRKLVVSNDKMACPSPLRGGDLKRHAPLSISLAKQFTSNAPQLVRGAKPKAITCDIDGRDPIKNRDTQTLSSCDQGSLLHIPNKTHMLVNRWPCRY